MHYLTEGRLSILAILMITMFCVLALPRPLQAQTDQGTAATAVCTDMETALDAVIAAEMTANDIPGLTLSLVAAGEVALSKGYGYANVTAQKPVDAAETLMPAGSVSKPVTWLALMQLVEAGQVDLDAPIDRYLPETVAIPDEFAKPITVADLMAHTAGFEDRIIGIFTLDPAAALSPTAYLMERGLPKQVEAPGTFTVYCNDCAILAATIIEQVSGVPFETYVEQNIFIPLQMYHSTLRQELHADFSGELATGYVRRGGIVQPMEMAYSNQPGAGGLITTAPDMARFMLAYLQGGELDGARILDEATVTRMFSGMFRHDDRLPGVSYGWFETTINGRDIFFHLGDTLTFSSMMALIPEEQVGLYLTHNRATGAPRFDILYGFMDDCFPREGDTAVAPLPDHAERATRFTGAYQGNRVDHSTVGKLASLGNIINAEATNAGTLRVRGEQYIEVEPLLFQNVADPDDLLAFRVDENDSVTYLLVGARPNMVWEKLAWYQHPLLTLGIGATALLLFVGSLIAFVVMIRRQDTPLALGRIACWTGILLSLNALAAALTVIAWFVLTDPTALALGLPPLVALAMAFSVTAGVLALLAVGLAILLWQRGVWSFVRRVHYTLFAVMGILFAAILVYWNFIPV
jgi:CubicO group peptidase (beta-lactamase class C family)